MYNTSPRLSSSTLNGTAAAHFVPSYTHFLNRLICEQSAPPDFVLFRQTHLVTLWEEELVVGTRGG